MNLKKIYKKIKIIKKIALITGGNRGIGKQISLNIKKITYITITTTSKKKNSKKLNAYLEKRNIKNIITLTLNLKNNKIIENITKYIIKKISAPLIIINNAGITSDNIILKMTNQNWNKVINVNLNATYHIIKNFLPKMISSKWGRIINISSIIANTGNIGQANYAASKAGIIGLSKSLAIEVAKKGITVNVISPGFIKTSMTKYINDENIKMLIPINKFGKTKNIAYIVKLLISYNASYITGETININGGLYMK